MRPCAYQVAIATTQKYLEVKVADDEGPYVLTDCRIDNLDLTAPKFIDVYAGARKVTYTPISDVGFGGNEQLGIAFPAPMYIGTGGALTIDRLVVTQANSDDALCTIGGFHTEESVWTELQRLYPEFRSISAGPYLQPQGQTDGPWARKVPRPFRSVLILQGVRVGTSTLNPFKDIRIDESCLYKDATGALPSTTRAFFGSPRVGNFLERDVRSVLQVERNGSPTANTQIIDVMGHDLP